MLWKSQILLDSETWSYGIFNDNALILHHTYCWYSLVTYILSFLAWGPDKKACAIIIFVLWAKTVAYLDSVGPFVIDFQIDT